MTQVVKVAVVLFALALGAAQGMPQETTAEPEPQGPVPSAKAQQQEEQPVAPIERRASKPTIGGTEPHAGPLTEDRSAPSSQTVDSERPVDTIRVQTRLVNVALNVVDAKGIPVGGFDKQDFRVFENGRPQTIAVFEREATTPLSIVLAIDASETVITSNRLEREAAKHFVKAILRPQDELDLMDFADNVREIVPFTNESRRIEQGLSELQRGDETALYNAIYLASQRLDTRSQANNRRRVLVVISDGGDSVEHGEKYEDAVERAQRADTIIYTIIVVPIAADAGRNTAGEHALIQMSEDTGGKYYYVENPKDLEPAFRHISDDLRTQYVLGYYAPQQNGENAFRRIRVKLANPALNEKYSLRYRTGYYSDAP